MRKTKTTLKFLFVFALTVLLALALAACGDKPEDTGTAATTTAPATTTEPPAVTEKPEYTATFLREDKTVLMEVKFRRGDTTLSTVPEVPAKDGYFGTWPEYASKMYGDFSLEAEYTSLTVPTEKGLQFELSKDGTYYTLTDGGYSAVVVVPGTHGKENDTVTPLRPVKAIGERAFYGRNVKAVSLPESIAGIGDLSFAYCNSLKEIHTYTPETKAGEAVTPATLRPGLPEVKTLGMAAFYHCISLKSLTIPATLSTVPKLAFAQAESLETLNIPEGVMTIEEGAFFGCASLPGLQLPATILSVENFAFLGCEKMTFIKMAADTPSSARVGTTAFFNCSSVTEAEVPASAVSSLPLRSLVRVTVLSGTTLDARAFNGAVRLESVSLPETLHSIGALAFYGCPNLRTITVRGNTGAYRVEDGALYRQDSTTGDTLIFVPATKEGAFAIPASVTKIESGAFAGCDKITSVTLPAGLTRCDSYAFEGCTALTELDFSGTAVAFIGDAAFADCAGLQLIKFPAGLMDVNIGSSVLSGCLSIKEAALPAALAVTLPRDTMEKLTVTSGVIIGRHAFYGWENLAEVVLPANLIQIGADAFANTKWYKTWESGTTSSLLAGPSGEYLIRMKCRTEADARYEIPAHVTVVAAEAFRGETGLQEIVVGNDSVRIGMNALAGCTGIRKAVLPYDTFASLPEEARAVLTSLTIISGAVPEGAFTVCSQLTEFHLGDAVSSVGKGILPPGSGVYPAENAGGYYIDNHLIAVKSGMTALEVKAGTLTVASSAAKGAEALTSVTMPDTLRYIGSEAFAGCSALHTLKIPSAASAPVDAFEDCAVLSHVEAPAAFFANLNKGVLTSVVITAGETLSSGAFRNSANLTSVTFSPSANIRGIGEEAFSGCEKLTTLTLPATIETIGRAAFVNCPLLTGITIPAGTTAIAEGAFRGCTVLTIAVESTSASFAVKDDLLYKLNADGQPAMLLFAPAATTSVTIPETVTRVGSYAFAGCAQMTAVAVPATVVTGGERIFAGCSALRDVSIPVALVGNGFVADVPSLVSLELLGKGSLSAAISFNGHPTLEKLVIGPQVLVTDYTFYGCAKLEVATVPASCVGALPRAELKVLFVTVGEMKNALASAYSSLGSIVLQEGVTKVTAKAFASLPKLTDIYVSFEESATPEGFEEGWNAGKTVHYKGQWTITDGRPTAN